MRTFLKIALACLALGAALPVPALRGQSDEAGVAQALPAVTVHLGKAALKTEIASTAEEGEIGLMYRKSLPDNSGMLFVLPLGTAQFWMKNTLIPLSIAFLDRNGVVLELHDMKAMDETITRSDSDQVAYALEANLHWFALNGIKPGMKMEPNPAAILKEMPMPLPLDYHNHPQAHSVKPYTAALLQPWADSARARGLREIAFTDHDRYCAGVDFDEIDRLREANPDVKFLAASSSTMIRRPARRDARGWKKTGTGSTSCWGRRTTCRRKRRCSTR